MTDQSNIYEKLIQANLAFINATIDLVQEYDREELENHCYYHLEKFSRGVNPIYDFLKQDSLPTEQELNDFLNQKEQEEDKKTQKANKLPHPILSNLKQALRKVDKEYIEYFVSHQPRAKIQLKLQASSSTCLLKYKKFITDLDPKITDTLFSTVDPERDPQQLQIHEIKRGINKYILSHQLQKENNIEIDQTLQDLLGLSDQKPVHYVDFHQKLLIKLLD